MQLDSLQLYVLIVTRLIATSVIVSSVVITSVIEPKIHLTLHLIASKSG